MNSEGVKLTDPKAGWRGLDDYLREFFASSPGTNAVLTGAKISASSSEAIAKNLQSLVLQDCSIDACVELHAPNLLEIKIISLKGNSLSKAKAIIRLVSNVNPLQRLEISDTCGVQIEIVSRPVNDIIFTGCNDSISFSDVTFNAKLNIEFCIVRSLKMTRCCLTRGFEFTHLQSDQIEIFESVVDMESKITAVSAPIGSISGPRISFRDTQVRRDKLTIQSARLSLLNLSGMNILNSEGLLVDNVRAKQFDWSNVKIASSSGVSFVNTALGGSHFLGTSVQLVAYGVNTWSDQHGKAKSWLHAQLEQGLSPMLKLPDASVNSWAELPLDLAIDKTLVQYRALVQMAETMRDFRLAESFHFSEMEMLRWKDALRPLISLTQRTPIAKLEKTENLPKQLRVSKWLGVMKHSMLRGNVWIRRNFSPLGIYYWLSQYGGSYWHAVGMFIVFLFACAFLLMLLGVSCPASIHYCGQFEYSFLASQNAQSPSFHEFLRDLMSAVVYVLEIATLQKDQLFVPAGLGGRMLRALIPIAAAGQVALIVFALRRRFRRATSI